MRPERVSTICRSAPMLPGTTPPKTIRRLSGIQLNGKVPATKENDLTGCPDGQGRTQNSDPPSQRESHAPSRLPSLEKARYPDSNRPEVNGSVSTFRAAPPALSDVHNDSKDLPVGSARRNATVLPSGAMAAADVFAWMSCGEPPVAPIE